MNAYLYLKALHLISMVAWFAGMFYLVRLFIYHTEAFEKPDPERRILHATFTVMERRLSRAIMTPAMLLTVGFGIWLMILMQAWTQPWFHMKMFFLLFLFGYHGMISRLRRFLAEGKALLSSVQLRVLNEMATLLLFCIVFAAVIKVPSMIAKALGGLMLVSFVIGVMMYLGYRKKGMLGKQPVSLPEGEN